MILETYPSRYGFIIRSSPIMCVLDTLYIVFHVTFRSPRAAALNVMKWRFRGIDDQAEDGSLATLQKNTPFRLLIFVLGALPQVVELYAMSGTPMTQLWGSISLSSFIVLELMVRSLGSVEQVSMARNNEAACTGGISELGVKGLFFGLLPLPGAYLALAARFFEDGYWAKKEPQILGTLLLLVPLMVGYTLSVSKFQRLIFVSLWCCYPQCQCPQ